MGEFVSLLAKKKSLFPPFLDTKRFLAMKIASHHGKQLTPSESLDQYVFFLPWFMVSSKSNLQARVLSTLSDQNQSEHLDRLIQDLKKQTKNLQQSCTVINTRKCFVKFNN